MAQLYSFGVIGMSAKGTIQFLAKSTFLGFFFGMCLGLLVGGAIVPAIFWRGSNLGPLIGAIYGVPSGAIVGVAFGFIFGVVRIWFSKRREARHSNAAERGT